MNDKTKLSANFNNKLLQEIKRISLFKKVLNITLVSFLKVIVSVVEVIFKASNSAKKH